LTTRVKWLSDVSVSAAGGGAAMGTEPPVGSSAASAAAIVLASLPNRLRHLYAPHNTNMT